MDKNGTPIISLQKREDGKNRKKRTAKNCIIQILKKYLKILL